MSTLPWHRPAWTRLLDAYHGGRLPHALLLSGPDGIGLGEFASATAAALLCDHPGDALSPCGGCRACILVRAGNHPDILRVWPEEPGKQIRVEEVRDLIGFMQLSSQSGRHKIAIVDPAEALNRSASNTLLKTLEEPPAGSLLILSCHQPGRLPVTVRSRCQQLEIHGDGSPATVTWLQLRLGVDTETATALLVSAGGAPFRAVALAETGALPKQRELMEDLCRLRREPANPVATAQRWAAFGFPEVLIWLAEILRHAAGKRARPSVRDNLSSENGHLQQLADELDLLQLVTAYDVAVRCYQGATGPYNLNRQGLLEEFIVHWQSMGRQDRRQ